MFKLRLTEDELILLFFILDKYFYSYRCGSEESNFLSDAYGIDGSLTTIALRRKVNRLLMRSKKYEK